MDQHQKPCESGGCSNYRSLLVLLVQERGLCFAAVEARTLGSWVGWCDLIGCAIGIGGVGGAIVIGIAVVVVGVWGRVVIKVLNCGGSGEYSCDDEGEPEDEIAANVGAGMYPPVACEEDAEVCQTPYEREGELVVCVSATTLQRGRGQLR